MQKTIKHALKSSRKVFFPYYRKEGENYGKTIFDKRTKRRNDDVRLR